MTPTTMPRPFFPAHAAAADPASAELREAQARRAAAQRRFDENARAEAEAQRTLFSAVRLWRICPAKLCRRQKACRGEAARCLRERWRPVVPPEFKALLQKIFAGQRDGMTLPEAIAAAQATMAAHRRAKESEAARAQSNSRFVPADAAPSDFPFVRAQAGARSLPPSPPPPPPPVTRISPLRRGPRVSQL